MTPPLQNSHLFTRRPVGQPADLNYLINGGCLPKSIMCASLSLFQCLSSYKEGFIIDEM